MKQIAAASAAALLVAGGAQSAAAQDAQTAAKSCVYLSDIDHTKIVDEHTILFYLRNRTILQNSMREPCYGLNSKTRFAYGSGSMMRLCTGNMITLLSDLSFGAVTSSNVCKLGMFLPVNEDEVADLLATSSKNKGGQRKQAIQSQPVELPPDAPRDAAPKDLHGASGAAESAGPPPTPAPIPAPVDTQR
jgi:hypothetical protein